MIMFSKSTFYECEIYLFGSWRKKTTGDVYTFTVNHQCIEEDFIYRDLSIASPADRLFRLTKYCLYLNEDSCMLRFEGNDYTVLHIDKHQMPYEMQWLTQNGGVLEFQGIHKPAETHRQKIT
jgi:hypothetical protein